MVRPRGQDLLDKGAKVGRLELVEFSAAVLRGIPPGIGTGANKGACRLAVAEVQPIHGDDDVDDAEDFARHPLAFRLELMFGPAVVIGDGFQRADKDDIFSACALKMMERE
jgi:hypothetical protein